MSDKLCTSCDIVRPLDEFYKNKSTKDGLASWCKVCHAADTSKRQRLPHVKAQRKAHKAKPEIKRRAYLKHVERKYGLTEPEYEHLFTTQGGRCLVCNEAAKLVVDHNHTTGEVRGLLCQFCNYLAGLLDTAPDRLEQVNNWLKKDTHENL